MHVDLEYVTYRSEGRFIHARNISNSPNVMKKPSCVIDGVPTPMHLSTKASPLQNEPMFEFPIMHDRHNELYSMYSIVKQIPITEDCPVAYEEEGTGFVKCTEPDNLNCKFDKAFGHITRHCRKIYPSPSPAAGDPVIHMKSKYSKGTPRVTLFVVIHNTIAKACQAIDRFRSAPNYNIV